MTISPFTGSDHQQKTTVAVSGKKAVKTQLKYCENQSAEGCEMQPK